MNRFKRIIAIIGTLCISSCCLFGCGIKKTEYKQDELNVWVSMINNDKEEYTKIAEKWSENNNGMKVNFIDMDVDDIDYNNINEGVDIVIGSDSRQLEESVLSNFSDEMPKDLFNKEEFVSKDLWDSVTYNGKQYGIPLTQDSVVLYYNKDKVTKAPETMEDLVEQAKSVGFITVINDPYFSYGFISAYGGYFYKYNPETGTFDDNNIGINTENGRKGLKFIHDLVDNKICVAGIAEPRAYDDFAAGNCAFFIGQYGRARTMTNNKINFGVSPIPTLENNQVKPLKLVRLSSVNKNSTKKDKAWEFLRYFMDNASEYIMVSNPKAPVLKKTLETDSYKNSDYLNEFYKQSLSSEPYPNIMSEKAYNTAINYNIVNMNKDKITFEECAESIDSDLNEAREYIKKN